MSKLEANASGKGLRMGSIEIDGGVGQYRDAESKHEEISHGVKNGRIIALSVASIEETNALIHTSRSRKRPSISLNRWDIRRTSSLGISRITS